MWNRPRMICKTFIEPVHGAIDGELHIRHELIEDCHAAINNLPWKVGSYFSCKVSSANKKQTYEVKIVIHFPSYYRANLFFQRVWNFGEAIRPAHFEENRMS